MLLAATLVAPVAAANLPGADVPLVIRAPLGLPVVPLPPHNPPTAAKVELGRKLLEMVAPDERIVTIEDSLELLPSQPNTVSLIAQREEGSPRSADKLLQATLRLRPDRIILGELRGAEAATFLDAINTGHSGSFTTLHAHSARKAMDRLALLVMAQGTKLSFGEVIRYLQTSIDVILQMGRIGDQRGIMEMYFPGLDD